jgi:hypothetical protein
MRVESSKSPSVGGKGGGETLLPAGGLLHGFPVALLEAGG